MNKIGLYCERRQTAVIQSLHRELIRLKHSQSWHLMHYRHKHKQKKKELTHDSHHHNMKTVPKQSQSTRTIFFEIASVGACCRHACGHHSDESEMTG